MGFKKNMAQALYKKQHISTDKFLHAYTAPEQYTNTGEKLYFHKTKIIQVTLQCSTKQINIVIFNNVLWKVVPVIGCTRDEGMKKSFISTTDDAHFSRVIANGCWRLFSSMCNYSFH